WQMPHACTLIRTCPAPGSGIGRSTISNDPPGRATCATRMVGVGADLAAEPMGRVVVCGLVPSTIHAIQSGFLEWYSRHLTISSRISPTCSSGFIESHFANVLNVSPRDSVDGWSFRRYGPEMPAIHPSFAAQCG